MQPGYMQLEYNIYVNKIIKLDVYLIFIIS